MARQTAALEGLLVGISWCCVVMAIEVAEREEMTDGDRGYHTLLRGTLSVDTTVRQIVSKMMDEISDEQLMRYARHVVPRRSWRGRAN